MLKFVFFGILCAQFNLCKRISLETLPTLRDLRRIYVGFKSKVYSLPKPFWYNTHNIGQ